MANSIHVYEKDTILDHKQVWEARASQRGITFIRLDANKVLFRVGDFKHFDCESLNSKSVISVINKLLPIVNLKQDYFISNENNIELSVCYKELNRASAVVSLRYSIRRITLICYSNPV